MLEQVLQQNASKTQAKSKQSQIQTLARHLSVFGREFSPSIHSSSSVTREPRHGWMGASQ